MAAQICGVQSAKVLGNTWWSWVTLGSACGMLWVSFSFMYELSESLMIATGCCLCVPSIPVAFTFLGHSLLA